MENIWNFFITPISIGKTSIHVSLLDILLKWILPLIVFFILYKLIYMLIRRLINKASRLKEETKKKLYRYIRLSLRILFFVVVILLSSYLLGKELYNYLIGFWKILNTPFITSGSLEISIISLLLIIPVFILSSWISKKIKGIVDGSVLKSMPIDESVKFSISKLIRYGILFLLLLFGLSLLGIDFTSLTVILGVLGIGIGFGLQGVVSNFFSGLVILIERPVKEGDRIVITGIEGDIEKIRMMSTIVTTINNETIFIPNSKLAGDMIYNHSYINPQLIIVNQVQVSYSDDLEKVTAVLAGIAEENPFGAKEKKADVRLLEFQDSGILMELRSWIKFAAQKQAAISWINFRIWKMFRENQITIPFPQRDLHIIRPGR